MKPDTNERLLHKPFVIYVRNACFINDGLAFSPLMSSMVMAATAAVLVVVVVEGREEGGGGRERG